jgi:hypothetical protein
MYKIRMRSTLANPSGSLMMDKEYNVPGQVSIGQAKTLVDCGAAVWIGGAPVEKKEQPKVETATVKPPEKAVKPRAQPKRKPSSSSSAVYKKSQVTTSPTKAGD